MRYVNDRKPRVDDGSIALVALCLIAKAQSRAVSDVDLARRILAHAVSRLNDDEAGVEKEIKYRAEHPEDPNLDYDARE